MQPGATAADRPGVLALTRKEYNADLRRLQEELLLQEEWIRHKGLTVVVLFEGAPLPARAA